MNTRHTASGVSPAKKVPQSWVRGEKLIYEHASNGNHVVRPERPSYPRASYQVNDIALIWFTCKEDCDDWLKWWHEPLTDDQGMDPERSITAQDNGREWPKVDNE